MHRNITCYANDVYSRSQADTIPASPVHQQASPDAY